MIKQCLRVTRVARVGLGKLIQDVVKSVVDMERMRTRPNSYIGDINGEPFKLVLEGSEFHGVFRGGVFTGIQENYAFCGTYGERSFYGLIGDGEFIGVLGGNVPLRGKFERAD